MIPPINFPIAVPTPCSNSPPFPINQFKPGICANAPIAANTTANSAITTPMAKTPDIADGAKLAIADKANIRADIKPMPAIPSTNVLISIPFKACIKPAKNCINRFTTDRITVGRSAARASIIPIINFNN